MCTFHNFCARTKKKEKENEEQRRKKIIENAENDKPLDNEGYTIYLDYLKKQKIFLSKLKERRKAFLNDDTIAAIFCLGATAGIGFIIGLAPVLILGNLDWFLITTIMGFSLFPATGFCQSLLYYVRVKKVVKQNRTHRKNKSRRKNKVKTTTNISRNFDEQVKPYPYNFKDIIYKRASALLDRVECLNDNEEKIKIKKKIGELLKEYGDGLKLAKNVGFIELTASKCESVEELQAVTISGLVDRLGGRLDQMNIEVSRMLGNQISETEREKERLLLEERLSNEPVVIDKEKIDGVLEQREADSVLIDAVVPNQGKAPKRVLTLGAGGLCDPNYKEDFKRRYGYESEYF